MKGENSMSLMQLPTPNTAAKVIVSFRYATAAPFLSNNITISQFWGTLTSSSVAMNALMIFALAITVVCYR